MENIEKVVAAVTARAAIYNCTHMYTNTHTHTVHAKRLSTLAAYVIHYIHCVLYIRGNEFHTLHIKVSMYVCSWVKVYLCVLLCCFINLYRAVFLSLLISKAICISSLLLPFLFHCGIITIYFYRVKRRDAVRFTCVCIW